MPAKGSGQFGPDVIVGSPEYFRLLRKKNPLAQRLAQKRYLARQRKLALAARLAVDDNIPIEQALEEVGTELKNISAIRDKMEKEGKIIRGGSGMEAHIPSNEEMGIVSDEYPFIRENADRWGVPYSIANEIMCKEGRDTMDQWEEDVNVWKAANMPKVE